MAMVDGDYFPLVVYGVAGILGVVGALGCLAGILRLQGDSRAGETVRRVMLLAPVGCAAGGFAAGGVGNLTPYTTDKVIALICIVAAMCVAASIAVAREWARRIRPSRPAIADSEIAIRPFVVEP